MLTWIFDSARYLSGIIFLVFGINGLMAIYTGSGFIPMPPPSEGMAKVMQGFFAAQYLMPMVKILEVLSALFLIFNRFVSLAILLLAPIVVNILCIHIFVEPAGLPIGVAVATLWGILLLGRWGQFRHFLKP